MQKLKQYWLLICLLLIFIGASFFWLQYRPYKARKDCAWKLVHQDPKPAVLQQGTPLTQEEINAFNVCIDKNEKDAFWRDFQKKYRTGNGTEECPLRNDYKPAQQAVEETNWWKQTTKAEYEACLRGKGF